VAKFGQATFGTILFGQGSNLPIYRKFGQIRFGIEYFGKGRARRIDYKRSYLGVPLGLGVRKQLGRKIIFRIRRGNGYFGSKLGVRYQDKYRYVVPSSINNPQGQTARDKLKQAVYNWKNVLTEEEKKRYNERATKNYNMSGYNLYIREYIKGEVS